MFGGWNGDVPGCLDAAAHDFAKRKEGETIPSHRKFRQRNIPWNEPSRECALAQVSEHSFNRVYQKMPPSVPNPSQAFGEPQPQL